MASAVPIYPGDGPKRLQSFAGTMHRNRAYVTRNGEDVPLTEEYRRTVDTEFAPAFAVLFRRQALEEVGLFDERLFTNWEDYDLCIRFTDAGWKMLVVGTAEVIHAHGQTTGLVSPFITYFSIRNRLICLFRYGSFGGILRNALFIARSFYWRWKHQGPMNMPCNKAFAKGILHFLLGIHGKGALPASRDDDATGKKR